MIHTGILISAFSGTSIVLILAVVGLAVAGLVVDILAKKKGKNVSLKCYELKKKEDNVSQDQATTDEVVSDTIETVDETAVEEAVVEEVVTEEVAVEEEVPPVEEVVPTEAEPVVAEETAVVETTADTSGKGFNSNAYSRSYMSKLIQAEQATQERYSQIKNELLSYGKMRSSVAWTNETFRTGNKTVARIMLRGKTVLLLLALDPNEFTTTKYAGEDVSDVKRYANTPMRLRVTSERRLKYALELIALLVGREGYEKNNYTPVTYSYEYQTDEQLIKAGLIKVE